MGTTDMEGTSSHPTWARTGLLIQEERVCCERARSWGRPRSAAVLLIWLTAAAALALMPAELALYDENHVLWQITSYPPTGVIRNLIRDSHPPLYYLLAQGWLALGGFDHPWAFRVLSLFLGLPALPLAFQIGRRLGGPRLGLSALTLLALNPWFLFVLILIRMYGLTATLGAWGVWIVLRLLDRPTLRRWVTWTLAQGLLLFTHYYGALLIAALWLTLLWRRPRGWRGGLLAALPVAALFALWLRQAYAGSLEHTVQQLSQIPVRPGPVEVVWHYGATALMGPFVDGVFARAASLALALGLSLTILVRRPRLRGLSSRGGELAVWVGLPLLLGALLALRWPFFAARYFAMLTVPGAVALAAGIHLLRRWEWIPVILALGLIGLSRFPIMAAQPLGLSGLDHLGPTLAVLNRADPVLSQARWHIDADHPFYEWTDPRQRAVVMEKHPAFWFVGVSIYAGEWLPWLEEMRATHTIDFAATYPHPIPEYGASLFHLIRKPETAPWQPATARWQNGLTPHRPRPPRPSTPPGASLRVGLRLHTDRPIPERWTLFLHLLDPQGRWLAGWGRRAQSPHPHLDARKAHHPLARPAPPDKPPRRPLHPRHRLVSHRLQRHPRLPLEKPSGDSLPIGTVDLLPLPRPPRWGHPVCPRAPAGTPSPPRPSTAGSHRRVGHPQLAAPPGSRGPRRLPGDPGPPQRPGPPPRPPAAGSSRPPGRTRVDPRRLASGAPGPAPRPGLAGSPLWPTLPRPPSRLAAPTPPPVEL